MDLGAGGVAGMDAAGGMGGAEEPMEPGEALYVQHCQLCHGENAEGAQDPTNGSPLGPDARHPVDEYVRWLVRNGSADRMANEMELYPAPMLPIGEDALPDSDLDLIIEYLSNREVFPQPTTGEGLYADYCTGCHWDDGLGAPTGRPLDEVTAAEVLEDPRIGHHPGEFDMSNEYMPIFSEEMLTDEELQMLADYITQTF